MGLFVLYKCVCVRDLLKSLTGTEVGLESYICRGLRPEGIGSNFQLKARLKASESGGGAQ